MSDPIKTGDTPRLEWTLDPVPPDSSTAIVTIKPARGAAIVERDGELDGATLGIKLTAEETATAGLYRVEARVTFPGGDVHTYPNEGTERLEIIADLT